MAFTITTPNRDGISRQYMVFKAGAVDPAKLAVDLETATGRSLRGDGQQGHLVTGELSYGAGTVVLLRLSQDEPALTAAEETAALAAIEAHAVVPSA